MCVICQQSVLTMLSFFDSGSSVDAVYRRDARVLYLYNFREDSKHGKYDCYQTPITQNNFIRSTSRRTADDGDRCELKKY